MWSPSADPPPAGYEHDHKFNGFFLDPFSYYIYCGYRKMPVLNNKNLQYVMKLSPWSKLLMFCNVHTLIFREIPVGLLPSHLHVHLHLLVLLPSAQGWKHTFLEVVTKLRSLTDQKKMVPSPLLYPQLFYKLKEIIKDVYLGNFQPVQKSWNVS